APLPWTADQLFNYLRHGEEDTHGFAVGPMAGVAHHLSSVPEADVSAIALYIASMMGTDAGTSQTNAGAAVTGGVSPATKVQATPTATAVSPATKVQAMPTTGATSSAGEAIFAGTCATCHDSDFVSPSIKTVPLAQTTVV